MSGRDGHQGPGFLLQPACPMVRQDQPLTPHCSASSASSPGSASPMRRPPQALLAPRTAPASRPHTGQTAATDIPHWRDKASGPSWLCQVHAHREVTPGRGWEMPAGLSQETVPRAASCGRGWAKLGSSYQKKGVDAW